MNYFKMALRGYARHRAFTALNLSSLIVGLFVSYAAVAYIQFERSYDSFHAKADQLYRVARTYRAQDYSVIGFPSWSGADAAEQSQQVAACQSARGVLSAAQFIISPAAVYVATGGQRVAASNILTTNTPAAFVSMFTWQPVQGSLRNFGEGTRQAILSSTMAKALLGPEALQSPLPSGQLLSIDGEDYTLAAIIADVPANAHFDFSLALSHPLIPYWGSRLYIEAQEGFSPQDLTRNLNAALDAFKPSQAQDPLYKGHFLQPITDIHLHSDILYETKPPGNTKHIALIGFFALFIVFITLFNCANLSLAIQSKQSRAIGTRRALGAKPSAIAAQFVFEGVLLALIALPVVALLIQGLMPHINALMGTDLGTRIWAQPLSLLLLLSLAIALGALAGLAPAIYLSGRSVLSLFRHGLQRQQSARLPLRQYLVTGQLAILISITSISYFVTQQIRYIATKDIGFQKNGILYAYTAEDKQNAFQDRVRQVPGVTAVGNGASFGIAPYNQMTYSAEGLDAVFDDANQLYLDYEALRAYGLRTAPLTPSTSPITLINRTAAAQLAQAKGITPDELLGSTITTEPEYTDPQTGQTGFPFVIAGIFEDINLFSLHSRVESYFITVSDRVRTGGRSIIAFDTARTAEVVQQLHAIHAELDPNIPLEMAFLDQNVAQLYEQDQRTATLLRYFNLIAVALAALGIIGITLFLAIARTKEIGIRRVLGASPLAIVRVLAQEYVGMVAIALVISFPVALYITSQWLMNFAYRIQMQYAAIAAIGLLALALAALLVGIVAYRAALANPVQSLRTE